VNLNYRRVTAVIELCPRQLSDIEAERIDEKKKRAMAVALGDLIRRALMTLVDIAGTKWAALRTMDDLQTTGKRFSRFSKSGKRWFVLDSDGAAWVGTGRSAAEVAILVASTSYLTLSGLTVALLKDLYPLQRAVKNCYAYSLFLPQPSYSTPSAFKAQ
jgi:hypothetical protein